MKLKKGIMNLLAIIGILTAVNLSAKEPKNIEKNNNISIKEERGYIKKLSREIENYFGTEKGIKGSAKIKFIVDSNEGKVMTFFIYSKEGNKDFKIFLKKKLKKIKNQKFSKQKSPKPLKEVSISLKYDNEIKISEAEKLSIFKKNPKHLYQNYLKYLISEKGLSKKEIKLNLNSSKDTFLKSMLFAIYFDYENPNKAMANKYYNILIKRFPEKLKERKEGILVSDWLLRNKMYNFILQLFPNRSCAVFKKPEKFQCYYFVGVSKYKKGLDYEIDLSIAKTYYDQAKKLLEEKQ